MTPSSLPMQHPIQRVVLLLRVWLILLATMMVINANTAVPYLLAPEVKALPYYVLTGAAIFWAMFAWNPFVVIGSFSTIAVGTFLRGLEILLYAKQYSIQQRITGTNLWWMICSTTLVFGLLSLIATSRREAEAWFYEQHREDADSLG